MHRYKSIVAAILCVSLSVSAADIAGGTQLKQSAAGSTPALCGVYLGSSTYQACLFAALGSLNYNPIVQANDSGIIFNSGGIGTGAFVLAPHSSSSIGLRMTNSGTTLSGAFTLPSTTGLYLGSTSGGQLWWDGSGLNLSSIGSGAYMIVSGGPGGTSTVFVRPTQGSTTGQTLFTNTLTTFNTPLTINGNQITLSNGSTGTLSMGPSSNGLIQWDGSETVFSSTATMYLEGSSTGSSIVFQPQRGATVGSFTTNGLVIGASGTAIGTCYMASASETPGAIPGNNCSDSAAITVTGVVAGDACVVGVPSTGAGTAISATCYVSAANAVKIRWCDSSASANTGTSGTYTVRTFH
jgi:hypothetical protein